MDAVIMFTDIDLLFNPPLKFVLVSYYSKKKALHNVAETKGESQSKDVTYKEYDLVRPLSN